MASVTAITLRFIAVQPRGQVLAAGGHERRGRGVLETLAGLRALTRPEPGSGDLRGRVVALRSGGGHLSGDACAIDERGKKRPKR